MSEIHTNQKVCARNIISAFEKESYNHVLLLAQMQMGKSGTYWFVIFNMLFGNSEIKHILIISGNRETELYKQVDKDKNEYIEWYLNQKYILKSCSKTQIETMRKIIKKRIRIIWGSCLGKSNYSIQSNTLIVWDESHFAQSINNKPFDFFKKNEILYIADGSDCENKRNILLLTVSATPFSELVLNIDKTTCKTVKLEPGENYYGINHYRTNNVIKPAFIICEDTKENLKNILRKYKNDNKYAIIRVNNKYSMKIVKSICYELDIIYKVYNSKIKEILIEQLSIVPDKLTVVVISGMLRMGKVVPKGNICMVFESSTKNNSRKADTGLQGLLGRMCGYTPIIGGFNVTIYIEESLIFQVDEYIKNYNTKDGPITTKAMNVYLSVPIKRQPYLYNILQLPIEDCDEYITEKGSIKTTAVIEWLDKNIDEIKLNDSDIMCQLKNLVNSGDIIYHSKNTDKLSNNVFRNLVENISSSNKDIMYRLLEKTEIYLIKYSSIKKSQIWLIFKDNEELDLIEQEDIGSYTGDIYISNKCIFKNLK